MSDTHHARKPRRVSKVNREGSIRQAARQSLHRGDWEDVAGTMPNRFIRREAIA